MKDQIEKSLKDSSFCEHGNRPPCSKCLENQPKIQSSREYSSSPAIQELLKTRIIFEKPITPDSKVLLIGDAQGSDTALFVQMGVDAANISSVNYELAEIEIANERLKEHGVVMKQGDATNFSSLERVGLLAGSQDVVTLMHVLEVPDIRGEAERQLVDNMARVLKENGEAIVTQYKKKLTADEAVLFGVEEIRQDDLKKRFGEDWQEGFEREYGQSWREGMRYSEISTIRSKEELLDLFAERFDVKLEETEDSFVLKLKNKTSLSDIWRH
jgi:2-polyprenyl-3-methyl-5-hydroxy-6-metoxy-1,4-benzoquinol methylase